MGDTTEISWTDHTFNPWIGCTAVSAACDHCYAETLARRYGWAEFKAGAPRHRTSPDYWKRPLAWNRQAEAAGKRSTVFSSLCDPFDAEVDDAWRSDYMGIIEQTPWLEWLVLTKRAKLARKWLEGRSVPANVRMGTTAEDQKMLDLRGPDIVAIKAELRPFLSAEPLLGGIDAYHGDPDPRLGGIRATQSLLGHWYLPGEPQEHTGHFGFGWVIAGGESGPKARPSHPDWFRSLRDQCIAADVPFFFKQWGEHGPYRADEPHHNVFHLGRDGHVYGTPPDGSEPMVRYGKKRAGAMLDGREWREFPNNAGERR